VQDKKPHSWQDAKVLTRKLAVEMFGRGTLASHSLTGSTANAFKGKPVKLALDPAKVKEFMG
jgi:BEN domain